MLPLVDRNTAEPVTGRGMARYGRHASGSHTLAGSVVVRQACGRVYFAHVNGNSIIKVGWAYDPAKRLRRAKRDFNLKSIEMIGHVAATRSIECRLHNAFRRHRIVPWFDRCREFYHAAPQLHEVIGRIIARESLVGVSLDEWILLTDPVREAA